MASPAESAKEHVPTIAVAGPSVRLSNEKRSVILMAQGLLEAGKPGEAAAAITKEKVRLEELPELHEKLWDEAERLFAEGMFQLAKKLCDAMNIDWSSYFIARGKELFREGNISRGRDAYIAAETTVPDAQWRACGVACAAEGNYTAFRDCIHYMTKKPTANWLQRFVVQALQQGQMDAATEICDQYNVPHPKEDFRDAAIADLDEGRMDDAVVGFDIAEYDLENDKPRADRMIALARAMLKKANVKPKRSDLYGAESAKQDLRELACRGLALAGDTDRVLSEGQKLMNAGEEDKALQVFNTSSDRDERAQDAMQQSAAAIIQEILDFKAGKSLPMNHVTALGKARKVYGEVDIFAG